MKKRIWIVVASLFVFLLCVGCEPEHNCPGDIIPLPPPPVDEVMTTPVPGALLLGMAGIATVNWLKGRKKL
jgi:hypothetical protein